MHLLRRVYKKILLEGHALTHRRFPKVLANSMPKAGTNLLIRLLELFGQRRMGHLDIGPYEAILRLSPDHSKRAAAFLSGIRPGFFASAHFYYSDEIASLIDRCSIKTITIVRDPRDVCVSDAYYIMKNNRHRLHPFYATMSAEERLMASITGMSCNRLEGDPPSLDIGTHYRRFSGWLSFRENLTIRFEDLIGTAGGGSRQAQGKAVSQVADYLGLRLSPEAVSAVCKNLFWTGSKTFREGRIESWKNHFNDDHVAAFSRIIGNGLEVFGYDEPV